VEKKSNQNEKQIPPPECNGWYN